MAYPRPVVLSTGLLGVLAIIVAGGCSGGGGGSSSAPALLLTAAPTANPNDRASPKPSATAQAGSPSLGTTASASPATPVVSPSATATPAPASAPTASGSPAGYIQTSGVSDAAYASISNPGPWPSNFRPYCANAFANAASPCPWNDSLPDNPSQLYPGSATIVAAMFAASNILLPGDWSISGDYNHAAYLASSADHLVTVTCT